MKIEDLTICPALFSCYIAKKNKNGTMSAQRKELSKEELLEAAVFYVNNYVEDGTKEMFEFKDGTKISFVKEHVIKKEEKSE